MLVHQHCWFRNGAGLMADASIDAFVRRRKSSTTMMWESVLRRKTSFWQCLSGSLMAKCGKYPRVLDLRALGECLLEASGQTLAEGEWVCVV
jgi:hypothetical protein